MTTVIVPIAAPTQRTDGKPLSVSEIAYFLIQASTDAGSTYREIGRAPRDAGQFSIDIPDGGGDVMFKANTVDNQDPPGVSVDSNVVLYSPHSSALAPPNPPQLGEVGTA